MSKRRGWGTIRVQRSGRLQAEYTGPDLLKHHAPATFTARVDAEGWLAAERRLVERGVWTPPETRGQDDEPPLTLRVYANQWLLDRDLKPKTKAHYRQVLDAHVLPVLGEHELQEITPLVVRSWWSRMGKGSPTSRAHAYSLLRTILNTAVAEQLLESQPCHIRGAGNTKAVHKVKPATVEELTRITEAMPDRYQLMPMLAGWCALRFGELTELRRKDVDVDAGVIRIRRAVTWVRDADPEQPGAVLPVVGVPKTGAGVRDVHIPPHLLPMVDFHLQEYAVPGREGLLFPAAQGGHMRQSALFKVYEPARRKAGRPDLRWHDLRHTGAVLAASTGATLAELMARLGHSTAGAAMRYQHAAQGRDQQIAAELSKLVIGGTD